MKCDFKQDCVNCPHEVCLHDIEPPKKDRREYMRNYYKAHREELIEKSKERWRKKHGRAGDNN